MGKDIRRISNEQKTVSERFQSGNTLDFLIGSPYQTFFLSTSKNLSLFA